MSGTVRSLEWRANNTPVDRHTSLALAVAVEEGALTEEEAEKALEYHETHSGLDWITSDHYPGDEFYDKADLQYGGLYE